jgi:hypothetical protein
MQLIASRMDCRSWVTNDVEGTEAEYFKLNTWKLICIWDDNTKMDIKVCNFIFRLKFFTTTWCIAEYLVKLIVLFYIKQ